MSVCGTVPDDYTLEIVFQRLDAARFASLPLRSPSKLTSDKGFPSCPHRLAALDRINRRPAGLCLTRHPLEILGGTGI